MSVREILIQHKSDTNMTVVCIALKSYAFNLSTHSTCLQLYST